MANSHLPPEILDCIVDILHDELETLKGCRLVSKSWIPRTRRYLFAGIQFFSVETVESWKENFPDPSNSPAYYTRTLSFRRAEAVTAAGGLTQSFSRVVRLELTPEGGDPLSSFGKLEKTSLIPFHGFSPLKSLYMSSMTLSHPQILSLIRSSPFLEDLSLIGHDLDKDNNPDGLQAAAPWTSPALTGSLELLMTGGIEYITRRLLDLPGGLRFQQLMFSCLYYEDIWWRMELVVGCSDTLERLDIRCRPPCTFILAPYWSDDLPPSVGNSSSTPIDLSKAKKLRGLDFWPESLNVGWITMTLQTITRHTRTPRSPTNLDLSASDLDPHRCRS